MKEIIEAYVLIFAIQVAGHAPLGEAIRGQFATMSACEVEAAELRMSIAAAPKPFSDNTRAYCRPTPEIIAVETVVDEKGSLVREVAVPADSFKTIEECSRQALLRERQANEFRVVKSFRTTWVCKKPQLRK
jgi:hypothetical protein